MQNEFRKRFCWGVLITYSSIVFFGELIHAIPGMECHDGCVSAHGGTSTYHGACSSRPHSVSTSEQPTNKPHCLFCEARSQKSTVTEHSASVSTLEVAPRKNGVAFCNSAEPCPVCKLMAGFSSSLPQYSETDLASELVSFAVVGENHLPLTFSVPYSPRGPPRDVIL